LKVVPAKLVKHGASLTGEHLAKRVAQKRREKTR